MPQEDSILKSVKKAIGLDTTDTSFDFDVIMHINSVFSTLHQLGVGPEEEYIIDGNEETWTEFIGDQKNINSVKSYIYLKVRMLFDPPATSFALDAIDKQIKEYEWRLNVAVEKPVPVVEVDEYGDPIVVV